MQESQHKAESATTRPSDDAGYPPLVLDQETIAALKELGDALAAGHRSLISEGYVIKQGRYVAPNNDGRRA